MFAMLTTANFTRSGFVPVIVTVAESHDTAIAFGIASGNLIEQPEYEVPATTLDVSLAFPFAVTLWGVTRTETGLSLELERAAADDDGCDMPLALSLPREGVDWKITQDAGPVVRLAVIEEGSY